MAERQALNRELKLNWISKVKSELRQSPLVSNMFFDFILLCFEELAERKFACPCDTAWNPLFATVYLFGPAVLVLLLMTYIKCFHSEASPKDCGKTFASIFGPAIFWIIIVFWDGQGFACAMTTWSGSYVEIDKAAPQKWCEPANHTSSQGFEYKAKTQRWYFMSQGIGMAMITLLTWIFVVCFLSYKYYQKKVHREPTANHGAYRLRRISV